MATIQNRPFSKDYSGLINQSVVAGAILLIAISSHEFMRRKRRGRGPFGPGLGSVETWEFGYLYQGRSWAKRPSPPLPRKWPLGWIKQVLTFPEDRFNQLRGVDASLYIRFLRGCFWFAVLQSLTTLLVLFPIHVTFSDGSVSPKSMTRASISSLVTPGNTKGLSLLWVHIVLLVWLTFTWFGTLWWICRGAFQYRAQNILAAANRAASEARAERRAQYDPHPHPQYPFHSLPPLDDDHSNRGLRLRTVMVTNIPLGLRSDKDLKEYFEYYLSRKVALPAIGLNSSTQPGLINKTFAFMFNRARRIPDQVNLTRLSTGEHGSARSSPTHEQTRETFSAPAIDRVVIVRRMNELAALLERREEILRLLETAHIKLARKALTDVQAALQRQHPSALRTAVRRMSVAVTRGTIAGSLDVESVAQGEGDSQEGTDEGEDRMQLLIRTLKPYLPADEAELGTDGCFSSWRDHFKRTQGDLESGRVAPKEKQPAKEGDEEKTIWDALLSLPRSTLDAYQPLIHLSSLFRGKAVPAIDYYTAKLHIVTNMITEKRSMPIHAFEAMSTAFVSFVDPADARRACKFLAVHPENPLQCLVTMAPSFEDLDWTRLMKPTFRVEFVKDWVVELGVWAFTIFWVFPVSFFVGLVNIQNLSTLWPGLLGYLQKHQWEEEILQSFLPTVLVSLLAILIPLILLLIAKRAHTIATLSALHDRIMTRYYKFLVVNVLIFFCVGTVALQSFLLSFKSIATDKIASVIAQSFPVAAPFYVGWFIFTTAMHGGLELALFGLPLLVYPATRRQVTPRKRAMGIRPRTFNYYYWLPNHVLVIHVLLVFALLNPLVIPFAMIYFLFERTIIKNQLLHVYAKNYEGNGQVLLIRIVRYSLDGLMLSQVVFLAYMVVNKKTVNVGVSAVLIIVTAVYKLFMTRYCRARFERDDVSEAQLVCGTGQATEELLDAAAPADGENHRTDLESKLSGGSTGQVWPWKLPLKLNFAYASIASRPRRAQRHHPNPFGPARRSDSTDPLNVTSSPVENAPDSRPALETCRENSREADAIVRTESPEQEDARPAVVTKHHPHPAWEDESSPSHTYDNPYYTRDIDNFLWLPRDPLDILNLDDTVDLRMSLTSQPGAGRLSAWREDEFIETGLSIPLATSFGSIDEEAESEHLSFYRRLDGTEQIKLPPTIASRVESPRQEEIEKAPIHRRQSKRRRASQSTTRSQLGLGRQSTIDVGSTGYRSRSFGSGSQVSSRRPSSFLLPPSEPRRQNRAASVDHELGLGRPRQMSTFTARSVLSDSDPASPQPSPYVYPHGSPSKIISVQEAVYGVAIAEEEDAAEDIKAHEEEEEEQAQQPKSWFTSWMFKAPT